MPNMKIHSSKRHRALVLAAIFIAMSLACMMCGCGSAASTSSVPGSYGVDPRTVDASGAEASDCCIVVAAAQGQAFKIPATAFAYAKSAIEGEGYAAVASADTAQVVGKSYALTKNSESGRKEEREGNELEFFSYAYNARATEDGVKLLETMNAAANDMHAKAQGSEMVMVVVASGVSDGGVLASSSDLYAMDCADVVSQLKGLNCIADYSGITVRFYGLGQSTGSQTIPASTAGRIQGLLSAIVEAGGGRAVVCSDQLVALGCDGELPGVGVVDFGADKLSVPALAKGQTATVELDESVLTFRGDSSEFSDAEQADAVLSDLAGQLKSTGYKVSVVGHTADVGGGSGSGVELSEERARAVADALVEDGVPRSQIAEVTGVGASESTSYDHVAGRFDEAQAKEDRKVVLRISA